MKSNKSLNRIVIEKILSNKISLFAIILITLFFLLAVFSYQIIPDSTPHANSIQLSIAKQRPGFKATFLLMKKDAIYSEQSGLKNFFLGSNNPYESIVIDDYKIENRTVTYSLFNSNNSMTYSININDLYLNDSGSFVEEKIFLFGTDKYGRDLLSRVILGTRVSFSVGFISVIISIFLGVFLGMIGGYYGGQVDFFVCWLINVVWSIPTLLLVIAITFVLGKGFWQVFVAVGLTMWVEVARVTRGEVLKISQLPYIEAVQSFGLSDSKIMWKHILPNVINPIIIISAANFATSILLESGLSFLGIGVQPPTPSWGMIIKDHYAFIIMDKAYLSMIPGLCIILLVTSFMLLGNALRDSLDTKSK
ncbi:ABC transporter permease [Flavobacteriales bacterium]|nr:ABC transporter permease [Flavobacteriales bacterium]